MTDSGASQHMMDWTMLTDEEKATIRELDDPIPLRTATQIIWIRHCVDIWIKELAVRVTACVAPHPDAPCVLSLGRLVDETGYNFHWIHGETPYFQYHDLTIYCQVNRDCPFLCPLTQPDASDEQPNANETGSSDPGGEVS